MFISPLLALCFLCLAGCSTEEAPSDEDAINAFREDRELFESVVEERKQAGKLVSITLKKAGDGSSAVVSDPAQAGASIARSAKLLRLGFVKQINAGPGDGEITYVGFELYSAGLMTTGVGKRIEYRVDPPGPSRMVKDLDRFLADRSEGRYISAWRALGEDWYLYGDAG